MSSDNNNNNNDDHPSYSAGEHLNDIIQSSFDDNAISSPNFVNGGYVKKVRRFASQFGTFEAISLKGQDEDDNNLDDEGRIKVRVARRAEASETQSPNHTLAVSIPELKDAAGIEAVSVNTRHNSLFLKSTTKGKSLYISGIPLDPERLAMKVIDRAAAKGYTPDAAAAMAMHLNDALFGQNWDQPHHHNQDQDQQDQQQQQQQEPI